MNLVLWYEGSSAAIPFFTLVALLALWFCVSVPLTFVGAFFGFRKRAIEHPVRTNQIPRQIPEQSIYTQVRKIQNENQLKLFTVLQTNFIYSDCFK
jgi:transmembrane 9 superfamily protein 2/4